MGRILRIKAVYRLSMALRTRSGLPPPKDWAMTTVPPVAMPENREVNRKITGKPTPTAAKAPSLTKLPTTQLSTIL